MDNNVIFTHNFCESRLNNNNEPELLNSYSSIIISCIPVIIGIPKNNFFKNTAYILILNGFCSFYYHYTLSWFGKHLDEVTMVLANYNAVFGLLEMGVFRYKNQLRIINNIILPILISVNTLPQYDYLFPFVFSIYMILTVCLIVDISILYNYNKTVNAYLFYSLIGAMLWIISELICNQYTKYGHVIWHCFFPFGFYKIMKLYDNLIS